MGSKFHEFGSLSGPYYEKLIQSGIDTPLHMRKLGKFLDSPFEKLHTIQRADPYPQYVFSPQGRSRQSVRWGKFASDSVNAGVGTPAGQATIISKLNDLWKQTDLDLGLILSPEGRESVSMVGDSLTRIANSAYALRKGNFDAALKSLKKIPRSDRDLARTKFGQGDLSSSFLAMHLGWSPLISDIYAASEVISERTRPENKRLKASVGNLAPFCTYTGSNKLAVFKGDAFGVQTILAATSRSPTFSERFGLANPFYVACNRVPLGFVADYFLPIGSSIAAAGFLGARVLNRGWYKYFTKIEYQIDYPPGALRETYNGIVYSNRQPVTLSKTSIYAKRERFVPELKQALDLNARLPASIMKLATISALTHQRILSLR